MKTSEEMSKSVLEKVRAYEVHKAAVRKRITAVSVTTAALAVCIFAGVAVTGNLRMGKAADSVANEENEIGYGYSDDYSFSGTGSTESVQEESNSSIGAKAGDPNGAGDVTYFSYTEWNGILPENSPLKNLEDRGFEISECSAQFKENEGNSSDYPVYAFADFIKGNASGTVFCDFVFNGTLDEYTASRPLSFPDRHKLQCGDTEVVYSGDGEGGYVALFEYDGDIYQINVGGVDSPNELQTLLNDFFNE